MTTDKIIERQKLRGVWQVQNDIVEKYYRME